MKLLQAIGPNGPRLSMTHVSVLVTVLVNLLIIGLKSWFEIEVPPDGRDALNLILGGLIAYYFRRGIDSARAVPQVRAALQVDAPPEG